MKRKNNFKMWFFLEILVSYTLGNIAVTKTKNTNIHVFTYSIQFDFLFFRIHGTKFGEVTTVLF